MARAVPPDVAVVNVGLLAGDGLPLDLARSWVAAGASYVGGCCRVGPAEIRDLADGLADA